MACYLGFDIGGTKSAVLLGRSDGAILERVEIPTDHTMPSETFIQTLIASGHEIMTRRKDCHPVGAGISCGGPLDSRRGVILSPPNLPGWRDVPVADMIRREFRIPVRLLNDADASALAEGRFGAGRGADNLVFLTFGTGMGAGLILNGRLYSGSTGMAGEIGHIGMADDGPIGHGKAGSFEGFCSGGGILRMARGRAEELLRRGTLPAYCPGPEALTNLDVKTLAAAARGGDAEALAIFRKSGEYLGKGLSILVDLLNPEIIIIGSIFRRAHDLLAPAALEALRREGLTPAVEACRIVPAELGESIGDKAALSAAMEGEAEG